jgi:hypothetical protein
MDVSTLLRPPAEWVNYLGTYLGMRGRNYLHELYMLARHSECILSAWLGLPSVSESIEVRLAYLSIPVPHVSYGMHSWNLQLPIRKLAADGYGSIALA